MSKLTALHITIIGVVTALIMSLLLFFLLIKPKNEDIDTAVKAKEAAEGAGGTDAKVSEAKNNLKKEEQNTKVILAAWAINQQRYMPNLKFGPDQKSTNLLALYEFGGLYSDGKLYGIRDVPTVWGVKVKKWYDAHSREGISRAGQEFPIPAFSSNPNDISKLTSINFPEGKPWHVSVIAKNFDAAMLHLRRFNSMRGFGMPVVDNVALAGQSPNLSLTYDMQLFVIPPANPPAADPVISSTGGGAGPSGPTGFGGSGGGKGPGAMSPK